MIHLCRYVNETYKTRKSNWFTTSNLVTSKMFKTSKYNQHEDCANAVRCTATINGK